MAITVLLNKPYCTLTQLQKELKNVDASDGDVAGDLVADWHHECINRASRLIDEYCQRDFWFHDHSDTVLEIEEHQVVGKKIWLDWPIRTLTEIIVDGTIVDADDYRFNVGKKAITNVSDWSFINYDDNDYVTVKGTFGYGDGTTTAPPTVDDPEPFPEGVRRACIHIASALTGDMRKEVVALDGTKVSLLDTSIPDEAKMLLRRYKKRFL